MKFDDDYPSCLETYATLRVFSEKSTASEIATALGLSATESFSRGDFFGSKRQTRRHSGWLLSTQGLVKSRDGRRHLAWLLDRLRDKNERLELLRKSGADLDISCYYLSVGQGGPIMSSEQMFELGRLGMLCTNRLGWCFSPSEVAGGAAINPWYPAHSYRAVCGHCGVPFAGLTLVAHAPIPLPAACA